MLSSQAQVQQQSPESGCSMTTHIVDINYLNDCYFLSDFDRVACETLYHFSNEEEMTRAFSLKESCQRINVPCLILQPSDDPLHVVSYMHHHHTTSPVFKLEHFKKVCVYNGYYRITLHYHAIYCCIYG